jgi:hypothetical protein
MAYMGLLPAMATMEEALAQVGQARADVPPPFHSSVPPFHPRPAKAPDGSREGDVNGR